MTHRFPGWLCRRLPCWEEARLSTDSDFLTLVSHFPASSLMKASDPSPWASLTQVPYTAHTRLEAPLPPESSWLNWSPRGWNSSQYSRDNSLKTNPSSGAILVLGKILEVPGHGYQGLGSRAPGTGGGSSSSSSSSPYLYL